MLEWIKDHQALLYWATGASIVLFVVTLIAVPALIVRIPPGYFAHADRPPSIWAERHGALRTLIAVGRNLLGVVLILSGLAMLVLPGQGLLTIFVGFLLIDFPRKYRLEKWLISRPAILKAINWLRRRRGRAPLQAAPG